MMLRCTFCKKTFQGTQYQATRHFVQMNYCKDVNDEALYEIARWTQQKFESDQMERVGRYAGEHGLDMPRVSGAREGEGGQRPMEGGGRGDGRQGAPDRPLGGGGGDTEEDVMHVDREARGPCEEGVSGHEDVSEFHSATGERMDWLRQAGKGHVSATEGTSGEDPSKRKEGGTDPDATQAGKRLRQQKVIEVYGGTSVARHKKVFLCWLYSSGVSFNVFLNQAWKAYQHVLLEQPGSSPCVVLPSQSEIVSMWAVETHHAELAEELEEVREPFWVTDAFILSDGRQSRDERLIVNFLAACSPGVVMYMTINQEASRTMQSTSFGDRLPSSTNSGSLGRIGPMRYALTPLLRT
ncbi:hypothetical protein CBR_g38551 [Chara braunii]|uniref:DUF659 domain-containing protein n=1 Tax=Chara braunii TaxID=69332 RepID=A0A388JP28_CHABU|nr:hypothetical protein CBR_g38551 [Chara braunii]|eukprot:GBG59527.1 hypothetical protein CBR_g38551 [Chara braunii]